MCICIYPQFYYMLIYIKEDRERMEEQSQMYPRGTRRGVGTEARYKNNNISTKNPQMHLQRNHSLTILLNDETAASMFSQSHTLGSFVHSHTLLALFTTFTFFQTQWVSFHNNYIRGTALVYRDLQRQNKPLDELASPPSK